jgi:hypothetical protein
MQTFAKLRTLTGIQTKCPDVFNTFLRERLTYLYGKNKIRCVGSSARF